MQNYLASLASLHNLNNLAAPDLSNFAIQQCLRGLQRNRKEHPNRKRAITPKHLLKIHSHLYVLPADTRAIFWAACLFAFHSLLRKSNLLPDSRMQKHIRVCDIQKINNGLLITLSTLKTHRFLAERHEIPLHEILDSPLCPVSAYKKIMKHRRRSTTHPLFSFRSGAGLWKDLNGTLFSKCLYLTLTAAGCHSWKFPMHSFRRGGATYSAKVGVSTEELKAQGTWKSAAYEQKVARDQQLRNNFSSRVADSLGGFGR